MTDPLGELPITVVASKSPYLVIEDKFESVVFGTLRSEECSCTHDEASHDAITGACHYTNFTYGPCPCTATPDHVRTAQQAAFDQQAAVREGQG